MLFRFSLYGFLKNQQYYDPFLILAFRSKGLSFTQIGLLIGFRELCINLMEVPTGAIADVAGRRRSSMAAECRGRHPAWQARRVGPRCYTPRPFPARAAARNTLP